MTPCFTEFESPIGRILLAGDDAGLRRIIFQRGKKAQRPGPDWEEKRTAMLRETQRQLRAYFAGRLKDFDLELAPEGTPFQRGVWDELMKVPYGETISYGALARKIRRPKASRAVGAANGSNPLPIVVPCHRVIGSGGNLVGYGGGLDIKVKLLNLEAKHTPGRKEQPAFL